MHRFKIVFIRVSSNKSLASHSFVPKKVKYNAPKIIGQFLLDGTISGRLLKIFLNHEEQYNVLAD